jgi:uncharacterized protein (TIGR03435 family)
MARLPIIIALCASVCIIVQRDDAKAETYAVERGRLLALRNVGDAKSLIGARTQFSTRAPATPPSPATEPTPPPTFEVSTVKQNTSGSAGYLFSFQNGRFTAWNASLMSLIEREAYGITELQIREGPKWLGSQRFDIEAKTDNSLADALRTLEGDQRTLQEQLMIQGLLADRFKLVTHWETRDLPVYALVVGKKGPKIHASTEPNNGPHTFLSTGQFIAQDRTLEEIARALTQQLSTELGRVIIDQTEIKGRYDITLKWTPDVGAAPMKYDNASQGSSGPSIFTAIQEQLGLKLEPTRAQAQVLIIDHAEMPSGN